MNEFKRFKLIQTIPNRPDIKKKKLYNVHFGEPVQFNRNPNHCISLMNEKAARTRFWLS